MSGDHNMYASGSGDGQRSGWRKRTIMEMARDCGINFHQAGWPELERFAEQVRADEREACHALRQTLPNPYDHCQVSAHAHDMAIVAYGAAIRARGQA